MIDGLIRDNIVVTTEQSKEIVCLHCGTKTVDSMQRRYGRLGKTINWKFTLVLLIVGFMIAVQYNSMKNPEERDTGISGQSAMNCLIEKQHHSELLSEIRELDKTILPINR